MGPEEYFKKAKEVAKPLYDKIEAEIEKNLLEKQSGWYSITVSDDLRNMIEKNHAIWQTVSSMYISEGWANVGLDYNFWRTKLSIYFINKN